MEDTTVLPVSGTRGAAASGRPFVGRARELTDLLAALDGVHAGRGELVLLTGEPGIGKTRLIHELARRAAEKGTHVVTGRCWEEGGAPPFWPWIQALRPLGIDLEEFAAGDLHAPSGGASAVMPEGARLRLFDSVGRSIAAAAAERPLVVALDDVHAADEPSLVLLRFLGDALGDGRVLMIASYRDAEPRVRALADAFAELARVGRRIPLRGLSAAEIASYVAEATGSPPSSEVAERLQEITGGNPFFVGEIVGMLAAEGSLLGLDDHTKDPLLRIPEEVRALIRRRVASLAPETIGILRIAAVIGREFDLHLLQRTSRLSSARLLEALDEAVAVGVLAELTTPARRYAFAHELVRETLYDDLPSARRLELHDEVGRLLEAVYHEHLDPHLSEIARHLYLAAPIGDPGRAHEAVVRAGERAASVYAYEEAVVHYRRALELVPVLEDVLGERRGDLLLRLGDAEWRAGDAGGARKTFEAAIDCGRRVGDGELLARAALGYVTALGGFLLYARFEVGATGVGLLEEALAALPRRDSSLRAHLLAHLALEMWSGNEPVEARMSVSGDAIEMARRIGDSEALVTALHARHWALTTPGMAMERLAHTEEMLRVAKETVNPEIEFLAHNARFHCFLELSDRRAMDAESEAMTELANRLRQPFYRWHTVCLRTLRATLDGRFDDAELSAREALELGRLRQSEYASYVFRYAQMFAIRWAQGRLQELWPAVEDGTDEFHAERFPWIPRWRDALAAAELGREDAARRELVRHAVRDFSDLPRDGLWLLHVCALAEVAVLVGDRERAGVLYELLLPHAEDNAVSYTQQPFGPVALRLGKLAALLGRWREVDRHFAAALARSELLGARAIRARILLEHARALSARGEPADRRRREAMIDEARQLCEEVGAPALFERFEFAVASSGREAALFRRDGDVWTIAYAAHSFSIRDVKGLGYIAALLERPGRELHVLELAGARIDGDRTRRARAEQTSVWPAEGAALLDDRAKDAYRARLVELEDDLDEARRWGDPERAAGAAEEIDALQQELARAAGFGGHDRAFASPAERARVSVTKAIRTAIRLVERHCPELARHLDESIQTGRFCSYAPPGAEPPVWSL